MARSIALVTPALAAALCLAACGESDDGPDLTGVWMVTLHTQNQTGCTPGAQVTDPPFIKFTRESIFGQSYFTYVDCEDAAGATCTGSLFGGFYAEAIADGWRSAAYVAAGDDSDCALGATISTVVVASDGSIAIETRNHRTTGAVGAGLCTTDEAKARHESGALPCESFDALTAVRVP